MKCFVLQMFCPIDVLSLQTFCPVDVLSCRPFVPVDVLSRRPFVLQTFCLQMFCLQTFCLQTFCPCTIYSCGALGTNSINGCQCFTQICCVQKALVVLNATCYGCFHFSFQLSAFQLCSPQVIDKQARPDQVVETYMWGPKSVKGTVA